VNAVLRNTLLPLAATLPLIGSPAAFGGDRLAWTGAVTEIEGSAGGGLVPWALIGGLGTDSQVGATGFATYVSTEDFSLRSAGLGVGIDDRVELSWARQRFDAGSVISGLTLGQDITGLKVRVAGDAVFAPDRWLPQIAIGAQWKRTLDFEQIPRALGAASGQDVDLYVAATKLYFAAVADRNLLIDLTLRRTRANQFGLLGFGGDGSSYRWEPEASAALFLTDAILCGAEYRAKPDNLQPLRENAAGDIFLAWGPSKSVSLVLSWVDLGNIATRPTQRGVYISLWLGI
jgi:hypothetical protein